MNASVYDKFEIYFRKLNVLSNWHTHAMCLMSVKIFNHFDRKPTPHGMYALVPTRTVSYPVN